MSEASHPATDLGPCLVTGAAGFLGRNLVRELLRRGCRVRAFARRALEDTCERDERLEVVIGDVRDLQALRKACEGIDTVFHTAAVLDFDRFPTRSQRERSEGVNVQGAENAVRAAADAGVRRLVHTSSNNVTFEGRELGGDETQPYVAKPRDLYTRTKILGERAVLAANGRDGLLTCAIRPGGIYGPGESLIFPTFVRFCARGQYRVIIGDGTARSDTTYIENLVDAQIEAARHLVPGSPVAGQAYFITDGEPINYFAFFRPYAEALGIPQPRAKIPAWPLYIATWPWELVSRPSPLVPLSLMELRKIAVENWNRIDKAERDFGWTPPVSPDEAVRRCIPYVQELWERLELVERPHWAYWLAIPFGMGLLAVLAFNADAHDWWSAHVTTWTPSLLLKAIFVWAALLHVYKGMKAVRLAEGAGLRATSMGWGWQTFLLGFPSLRLLERRLERMREPVNSAGS